MDGLGVPGKDSVGGVRRPPPLSGRVLFALGGIVLLVVYFWSVLATWSMRSWEDTGPLSKDAPVLVSPLTDRYSMEEIEDFCRHKIDIQSDHTLKVVGGHVQGAPYYGCYSLKPDGAVFEAAVIDELGLPAPKEIAKEGGAWRWVGTIKTPEELVLGAAGIVALLSIYYVYYRRTREQRSRGRRIALQTVLGFVLFVTVAISFDAIGDGEAVAEAIGILLLTTVVYGWLGGRALVLERRGDSSPGLRRRKNVPGDPTQQTPQQTPQPAYAPQQPGFSAYPTAAGAPPATSSVKVTKPSTLPTFADVGGMDELKHELRNTFGLLLAFADEAERYQIEFNGILLHGPPGVGKTFFAKAVAGEWGLNFLGVDVGDLVSSYVGQTARNIEAAFEKAATNVPCILFFDEFDSIAKRRGENGGQDDRSAVNQLLQSLEAFRSVRELIVMAATNHLDELDPAVVRPGRFDRHVRIDLPDHNARKAILRTVVEDRPHEPNIDFDELASRMEGLTPAVLP
jgi:hypothetical protein